MAKPASARFKEIRNSKAHHKYHIGDRYECGIVLTGTEVKSVRAGKAQISEAFVRVDRMQPILYQAHIDEYAFGNIQNHTPTKPRKLLLHKREIHRLSAALQQEGYTLVPIRLYLKEALVKVEIALCKGKQLYDKRQDLKNKQAQLEAKRALSASYRYAK